MTIQNNVEKIKLEVLFTFDFGKAEANEDELLDSCFCSNNDYIEILSGRKSLVIGEVGSGKTALFNIITNSDRKEFFNNPSNKNQILLPICEDLNYKLIKSCIVSKIESTLTDPVTAYRYLWELYIIYRIALVLKNEFKVLPNEVEEIISVFVNAFSPQSSKPTFFEFLASNKKTIGVKAGFSEIGMLLPEIYFAVEPSKKDVDTTEKEEIHVNIDSAKRKINDFLFERNSFLYVLFDNLDEFVIKDEYETQKKIIESLLVCHKNYTNFPSIKLKLFIRSDLYDRVDKSSLGGLKTHAKSVSLNWKDDDIREFIARRIIYNIKNFFKGDLIYITFDKGYLSISEKNQGFFSSITKKAVDIFEQLFNKSKYKENKSYTSRVINLTDKLSRDIITFIFPREVKHNDLTGKEKNIDIFEYFSSHFNLAHGQTTPRIIIIFLDQVLYQARDYLRRNPDQANGYITSTEENEFPLIKKIHISEAYRKLKEILWSSLIDETQNEEWKGFVLILKRKTKGKSHFSFKQLQKFIKCNNDEEMEAFLGYFTHKGLFKCVNRGEKKESRVYNIPVLFQDKSS